jgi:hypothetical protein
MTTTPAKREYMIAAVEGGRFHRISRPMVFMEGSVGWIVPADSSIRTDLRGSR